MDVLRRNERVKEFAKFISILVVWSYQKIHFHLHVINSVIPEK